MSTRVIYFRWQQLIEVDHLICDLAIPFGSLLPIQRYVLPEFLVSAASKCVRRHLGTFKFDPSTRRPKPLHVNQYFNLLLTPHQLRILTRGSITVDILWVSSIRPRDVDNMKVGKFSFSRPFQYSMSLKNCLTSQWLDDE